MYSLDVGACVHDIVLIGHTHFHFICDQHQSYNNAEAIWWWNVILKIKSLHTYKFTGACTGPVWLMDPEGTLSSPYVPCTVVMPHFSKHKSDDDRWYSHPFYSVPGGYNLCLCVNANGFGSGAGTHVSVFVYLMQGENDHQLQWPFQHSVTYKILNCKKNANHKISTILFKDAPARVKARVTSGERAPTGSGREQALSHTLLFDCKEKDIVHLHQDCLCLQVLKVEPPN